MFTRQIFKLIVPSTSNLTINNTTRSLSTYTSLLNKSTLPPTTPTPTGSTESELEKPSSSTSPSTTSEPLDPTTSPSTTPSSTETSTPTPATESVIPITSLAQQILDLTPDQTGAIPSSSSSKRTGAKAKGSSSKSSIEKKRQNLSRFLILSGGIGLVGGLGFLGREWDDEFEKMKLVGRTEDQEAVRESEEGGWKGAVGRGKLRAEDMLDYLNKPAWDPLIPPPLPEPHFRPYTLVVDLDDLLVHSSWDIENGWRTAKRPGVDYFLAYLSQFYEIVLFTTQPAYTAAPIVEKIDPYGAYIPWKLYRESTRYKNKSLIKDLSYLGRPLSRTIILDTNPSHVQLQPTNAILLSPWLGSSSPPSAAKDLISLIPFLEAIAIKGVQDVRTVIGFYGGENVAEKYARAEEKERGVLRERWEREKEGGGGVLRGLLGGLIKNQNQSSPPETDVEKVRKNAQRMYLEEQKYWKENEEIIKKQMEDDRERQLKEMKGSLMSMMGIQTTRPEEPVRQV